MEILSLLFKRKFVLALSVCCFFISPGKAQPALPEGFNPSLIFSGKYPVTMDFDPAGRLFVTDLSGKIWLVENDVLHEEPVGVIEVDRRGERGLYGIAFDPDFDANHYIYLYYCVSQVNYNRISRFELHEHHIHPEEEEILFEFEPTTSIIHNGGDLKFGPDGKLYVAIGDGGVPQNAQSHNSLFGKMLRLNADGTIPTDNPFYTTNTGVYKAIYAYGLRNSFTFSFSKAGRLFANDVGESTYEEINDILPGRNYGWPLVEGAIDAGVEPPDNYKDPLYAYPHTEGCAVTGSVFYEPDAEGFPDTYRGMYFFGDYCSGKIKMLDPDTHEVSIFSENGNSPVFMKMSPYGALFLASFNAGSLWKITYDTDGSPQISTQPQSLIVSVGEPIEFAVTATGAGILTYQWKKDGANIVGASGPTLQIAATTLADAGTIYTCVIQNANGSVESAPAVLAVTSRTRPDVSIDMSGNEALYRAGNVLRFTGSATDATQGALGDPALTWSVDFHHDSHSHPVMTRVQGVSSIEFTVPRVGETSSNVWYRIYLEAVNDAGLSRREYVEIYPVKSTFTVQAGSDATAAFPVMLDGAVRMTPFEIKAVAGMIRNLSVVSGQVIDGYLYQFKNDLDGGNTVSKTFTVPGQDTLFAFAGAFSRLFLGRGSGLTGNYLKAMQTFESGDSEVVQVDSYLNFNWGYQPPVPGVDNDGFRISWGGFIRIPAEGSYTFYTTTDEASNDEAQLWLGKDLLIGQFANEPVEIRASRTLKVGVYPITVRYFGGDGRSSLKVEWSSEDISRQVLPAQVLYDLSYTPELYVVQATDSFRLGSVFSLQVAATDYMGQRIERTNFSAAARVINGQDTIQLPIQQGQEIMKLTMPDTVVVFPDARLEVTIAVYDSRGFSTQLVERYGVAKSGFSGVVLYPNPVSGRLVLQWHGAERPVGVLNVYTTLGHLAGTWQVEDAEETKKVFDVSSLPMGMYFVKIPKGESFVVLRFVKQ